jgi:hypothetical protein
MVFVTVPVQPPTQDATLRLMRGRSETASTLAASTGNNLEWIEQMRAGKEPFFVIRVFSAYQTAAFAYASTAESTTLSSLLPASKRMKTTFRDQEVSTISGAKTLAELRWNQSLSAGAGTSENAEKKRKSTEKPKLSFGLRPKASTCNAVSEPETVDAKVEVILGEAPVTMGLQDYRGAANGQNSLDAQSTLLAPLKVYSKYADTS